jgi:hypothetical protein
MDLLRLVDVTHALGLVVVLLLVVGGAVVALVGWERYHSRHRPVHPLPTSEVFIDPSTHRRLRVWVDPLTGARDYREDVDAAATPLPPLHRPGLYLPPPDAAPPALSSVAEPPGSPASHPQRPPAE